MDKTYEFLKKAGTYFLATTEGDQPRVRPFGTIHLFEGCLYFQTGRKKAVADQLRKNPKIEISAFLDGKWIRVSATAILDERITASESLLNDYPMLKSRYQAGDGNTEVWYLKDAESVISSFLDAPIRESF